MINTGLAHTQTLRQPLFVAAFFHTFTQIPLHGLEFELTQGHFVVVRKYIIIDFFNFFNTGSRRFNDLGHVDYLNLDVDVILTGHLGYLVADNVFIDIVNVR
jgi:hypothetical protein